MSTVPINADRASFLIERSFQLPNDDASRAVVRRRLDSRIDVQDQLRHIVVPIKVHDRFGCKSAPVRNFARGGRSRGEFINIVEQGIEDLRCWNGSFGDALYEPFQRGLLTVD